MIRGRGVTLGGGSNAIVLTVDSGATVYATNGAKTVSGTAVNGVCTLKVPETGVWTCWATLNGDTAESIEVVVTDAFPIELQFGTRVKSLPVGTLLRLTESGAAANYRIVHQGLPSSMYDGSCDGTWLLRETVPTSGTYFNGSSNNYANSRLHSYLNSTHLDLFDSATQALIKQAKIPYVNGNGNSGYVASGANGLSTKIFALGAYELGWTTSNDSNLPIDGACLDYFKGASNSKRLAYLGNGNRTNWWSRSASKQNSEMVFFVGSSGELASTYCSSPVGIRPAMILDSNSKIVETPNNDGSYSVKV